MQLSGLSGITEGDLTGSVRIIEDDIQSVNQKQRVVGYFTSWGIYGRDYQVSDIPAAELTHINYAFANIDSDLRVTHGDSYADSVNFPALRELKEQHPHLSTLISVGGWTWSEKFSDVALTHERREAFAASAIDFMVTHGFDGIDIDWEYPVAGGEGDNVNRPEDKRNYTLLMRELREQLDVLERENGRDYWLSIAAPAGPFNMQNLEIAQLAQTLDWINLMSYDLSGAWDPITGHNSALYDQAANPAHDDLNLDAAVNAYLGAGTPPDKLVVGVPFYGRVFGDVGSENNGLYQADGQNVTGTLGENGYLAYWDISANFLNDLSGFTRHWDSEGQVPYLYNEELRQFVTYEDVESAKLKASYIRDKGLGGAMIWELSTDSEEHELLDAVFQLLSQTDSEINLI